MRILITASSSFAATGLPALLRAAGHEVCTFNRSRLGEAGPLDLNGSYEQLGEIAAAAMPSCDVLINYAIVKNGSMEQNIAQTDQILACARRLGVRRFVHISSISVLPSVTGPLNEDAVAVEAEWKGIYSRVKAAVEKHVITQWTWGQSELDIVRPGFILASGVVDSMVGTGSRLPTGHVLGLGNKRTVIMLIHRDTVNQSLVRIAGMPLAESAVKKTYMLVAPNAPNRKEFLDFQCHELGRGWSPLHFPSWFWRVGLACASPLLSLLKRRKYRLVTLFEHNLNVRTYDCTRTAKELGLDLSFDWRATLRDLVHAQPSPAWPTGSAQSWPAKVASLGYAGMGRIVNQKHLPALTRTRFGGRISWTDPALTAVPAAPGLNLATEPGLAADVTHAVITAPWTVRPQVLAALPASVTSVLLEKPFAVSAAQLDLMTGSLAGKQAAVLHNYRFKPNVLRYREFLRTRPSGALRAVTLHFETPSPANEQSAWMKQERRHRILLCDYAMHALDLAWIFCTGPMQVHRLNTGFNDRDELETISAALSFEGVTCDVLIRSGCHQRQCIITHHFQNYSAELRFFPDVFVAMTGGRSLVDDLRLGAAGLLSTGGKILEKLGMFTQDHSHDHVLSAFTGQGDAAILNELSVPALRNFYERLTALADRVYEDGRPS